MINSIIEINTPRLQLRVLELTDASAMQNMLAANKEYMLPYIPWAKDEPQTVKEKEDKIEEWNRDFRSNTKYTYGVFDNSNNQLLGLFFVFTRQGENILEIGYIIDYSHTGKGYASECTYALTKLCFVEIKIEKVVIICSTRNEASAKIPKKLGYILEYTLRNIQRNENGTRHKDMVWVMFIEEFKHIEKYEPTTFKTS